MDEELKKTIKKRFFGMKKAVEKNDSSAQYLLGKMYFDGVGVPQNDHLAAELYKKSAKQGNVLAQGSLGLLYGLGRGVTKDDMLAYVWLSVATANGMDLVEARDAAAESLQSVELAKAQELASKYFYLYPAH